MNQADLARPDLQIDNPDYPFAGTKILSMSMDRAHAAWSDLLTGFVYISGGSPGLSFLPSYQPNIYRTLNKDGSSGFIVPQERSAANRWGSTPEWGLHSLMNWLKDALVGQQAGRGLPIAHAFILRPRSLSVLRSPAAGEPGALFFHPGATGHELLEESQFLEARFPVRILQTR